MHLEGKVLFEIFDDHNEEGQLDSKSLVWVGRGSDKGSGHVGAHDFQHGALYISVGDALDVPIANAFVPNLKRFAADAVENAEKAGLKSVLKHL